MKNYNKALVLGSTGQGGSFMVKHLLKKGYYVYAFVRKSATGNLQNLENVILIVIVYYLKTMNQNIKDY